MKHYIPLFVFVLTGYGKIFAQPAGPNNSTNITDGGGGQISETWSNPNLARIQDNLYASLVTSTKNKRTNYIQAQSFGFAIPAGASIDGIVVEIDRYGTAVGGSVIDERVRLIDATGTILGTDRSAGATWPTSDLNSYGSYGGVADKWGTTWTASQINNANFGVAFMASTSNDNTTFNLFVDHMRVTVYYTTGGSQRYAVASSTWNNANTWASSPGGAPGAGIPTASSDVYIGGGFTVTNDINTATCNSLTIGTTEATPTGNLTFNSNARDISVGTGGLTITTNGDVISTFNPRVTVAGDLTLNKTLTNRVFEIRMSGSGGQIISGTGSLGILDMQSTGTNTGTLTITDQLKGTNNFLINGSTGYIYFSGSNSKLINLSATGNTIEFSHVLPAANYDITNSATTFYNLRFSGDATKRYNSNITVNGNLTITATGVVNNLSGRDITLYGNWANNNGAAGFIPDTGDVIFTGGNAQSITYASGQTFYRLVINKTVGTTVTALNNIVVTNRLTMTEGIFDMGSNSLTGAGTTTFDSGELKLGATGATVPQLTGAYTINGGTYTFNGAGAQTIRSTTSTPAIGAYRNVQFLGSGTKSLSGAIVVDANLAIGGTATLDVTASNFGIALKGNWTNTSTFTPRNGTVTLNGTVAQTVTKSTGESFYNLTLNNSTASNAITLGGPASVSNLLTFTAGHLVTTSSNLITLGTAASVASVSASSHVKGPVAKNTNSTSAFVFPTGNGSIYQSVSVTPTSTAATTYVAEYFLGEQPLGSTLGAGIDHISSQDYWSVQRTSGTANAAVTLSWNYSGTSEITVLSELRVAQWNGTQWANQGNAATTGNSTTGTIRSNTVTSFVQPYFVLASSTTNNPLSINRYFVAATGNWNSGSVWAYTAGGPATAPTPTANKNVIIVAGNTLTINDATTPAVSMQSLNIQGTIAMTNGVGANVVMTVGSGGLTVGASGNVAPVTTMDNDRIDVSGPISLSNAVNFTHTALEVRTASQSNTISGTGKLPWLNINNNNQVFTGSTSYTKLTVPNSATNNGTITVTGQLSGGGTLTNSSTGTIIWQGTTINNRVITATAVGNTVQVINNTGGNIDLDDFVSGQTFHHLVIGGVNNVINSANMTINGNLTINAGSVFNNANNNRQLTIKGNWTNNNGAAGFVNGTNTITFSGSSAQSIFTSTGNEVFAQLVINNTSSTGLTISQGEVHVTNSLTLTDGNIYTTATNLLVIEDNATAGQGSAASFVDGPMKKVGNDVFVFPVGNGTKWARLKMETLTNYDLTTEFTCQYFFSSYSDVTSLDASLTDVSDTEHWTLARVIDPGNNATCRVRLYWEDQTGSNISDLADLRVGHYYNPGAGLKWYNFGGSVTDNGNGTGEVVSTTTFTSFSPITFGSEFGFNPLPVELTSFTARVVGQSVKLNWSTASELNNDYYEIQRFVNAEAIVPLGVVKGNGTTSDHHSYEFIDPMPVAGKSYYRLKQVDFDKTYQYSNILLINFEDVGSANIFPNPGDGKSLGLQLGNNSGELQVTIYSALGVITQSYILKIEGTDSAMSVPLSASLPPGLYVVRIESPSGIVMRRWIVQ